MEKKIKIVIIGLGALIVILIFSLFVNLGSKSAILREKNAIKKENDSLLSQLSEAINDKKRIENKVDALNAEMDKLTRDKNDLDQKYASVDKERQELFEQVKKLKAEKTAAPAEEAPPPKSQTEDTYWAGVLKTKTDIEIKLEALRGELKNAQISNEHLQREKGALELEVNNLNREKQDYKRQIEYNQKLIDSISQELVREKNDKFQIEESTRAIKSENTTLRRQLSSLANRKMSLEKKLVELQGRNKSLDNRFNEMDVMLKEKMGQIDNLKSQLYDKPEEITPAAAQERESSVELPPIVVRPKQESSSHEPAIALIGKVLALNKENNFVIVDLGEDAGAKLGDAFKIYREAKLIAEVEVIQCRKSISACDVKKEYAPVKIGDIVK